MLIKSVFDKSVTDVIEEAQGNASSIDSENKPYPSPVDWRNETIYFLMIDRFNNPVEVPKSKWNQPYGERQGGNFKGITSKLDYLKDLGVTAIWMTPVVKNPKPENWMFNYHGYAAQDLLSIDERFASDGQKETAEQELEELIKAAHKKGIRIILDIVLNHMARVFDYWIDGQLKNTFQNWDILRAHPLSSSQPEIAWLNGFGNARADWSGEIPNENELGPDDAVHPVKDFKKEWFRRRGKKLSDVPDWPDSKNGFAVGDFGDMRQLIVEYKLRSDDPQFKQWGEHPVLTLLVKAFSYLIARFDFDGFRIDTVKYVDPQMVQYFGNAIREFAHSIGKNNFFTFGEIWDSEENIARFVGRNPGVNTGFGIDAAIDFPLNQVLKRVPKAMEGVGVEKIREIYELRKKEEKNLLSSHGEAGRFFVTFLDNHDKSERYRHPNTHQNQVTLALGLIFTLQGIPCIYYGTEQNLDGTVDENGKHTFNLYEGVREALWGKQDAFSKNTNTYRIIKEILSLRKLEPALRQGRQYFREISLNGVDFGHSYGVGGVIAFSRILANKEVLIVANTSSTDEISINVLVDRVLHSQIEDKKVLFSNIEINQLCQVSDSRCHFWNGQNKIGTGFASSVKVFLRPEEFLIIC